MTPESGSDIDPRAFRDVLGYFPTGVTIITAQGEDAPVGMACNSFASVSLDPPLVGIAAAKTSSTWPDIEATGKFCINIMADVHEDTCRQFSQKGIDRFAGTPHKPRAGGPGLEEAMAWIDCDIYSVTEAGDHLIILGRVLAIEASDHPEGKPLVFYRGKYGSFAGFEEV